MAIASAVGFLADCIWILVELRDVGVTGIKLTIMALLHISLFMQTYALYKFHGGLVKQLMSSMKTEKQAACKAKARISRKKAEVAKRIGAKS